MIHKKIADVMREIEHIGKEKTNSAQKFKYRGIDDVYNALHPLLAKNGLFCTTNVLSVKMGEYKTANGGSAYSAIVKVRYDLCSEDGSFVSSVLVGEGKDSYDKAINKALSITHKYFFLQMFAIPTAETDDPDASTPPPTEKQIDYTIVPSGKNAGKKWEELDKQTLHKSLTYYTEKRETRYAEIISHALRKHPITAAEETDILVDTHGDAPDVHATPTSAEDRDLFDEDK